MNKIDLNTIDWDMIQKTHDSGVYWSNLVKHHKISFKVLERASKSGFIIKKLFKRKLTNEQKEKISVYRKQYLKNNPDKHPWKNNDKFKSKPCELFKSLLGEKNIKFISEYQPSSERYYSIDIAFPGKLIGIEINGNQHYNSDGTLKEYYQKRNDFLKNIGWTIYNIHYSLIYSEILVQNLINKIKEYSLNEFEYSLYTENYFNNKKEITNKCKLCETIINKKSKHCNDILSRKVIRPTKDELSMLIKTESWVLLGKKFNVSDCTVRKWAKFYNLI